MQACKNQYNKVVKHPANFNLDKNSFFKGWLEALKWALKHLYRNQYGHEMDNLAQQIKEELGGE